MDPQEYSTMNDEERAHLQELRAIYQKRLWVLEKQAASYGLETPAHIVTQIDDLRNNITNLDRQLSTHAVTSASFPSQTNISTGKLEILSQAIADNKDISHKLRIFLCHSSNDKPAVRKLYQQLLGEGFAPWLDEEDLLPGQDWQREIPKAVKNSDVVIVCLSRNSISKSGYVQKEIKHALDLADELPEDTIFIIPLRLEDCRVPERLARWHWVNIFEERGFNRLLGSLRRREDVLNISSQQHSTSDLSSVIPTRKISFLTFDSRPLLGQDGRVWEAPYDLSPNVADLLNDIYMALDNHVPPFTYEDNWILRDRSSGYIYVDIGTKWSEKHFNKRWDERSLSEVGIMPGMHLEIIRPSRK